MRRGMRYGMNSPWRHPHAADGLSRTTATSREREGGHQTRRHQSLAAGERPKPQAIGGRHPPPSSPGPRRIHTVANRPIVHVVVVTEFAGFHVIEGDRHAAAARSGTLNHARNARPDRDIRLGFSGRIPGQYTRRASVAEHGGPGACPKLPIAGQDIPVPSADKSRGSFTAPSQGHRPSRAGPMWTAHARIPVA